MRQITVINEAENEQYLCDSRSYRILFIDKSFHEVIRISDDVYFNVDVEVFDKDGNKLDDVLSYIKSCENIPPDQLEIEGCVTISKPNNEIVAEFALVEGFFTCALLSIMLPSDENAKHFICCHSLWKVCPYERYNFYDFDGKLLESKTYMVTPTHNADKIEHEMKDYVPKSSSENK